MFASIVTLEKAASPSPEVNQSLYSFVMQHFLPLPQGHGSFLPTFFVRVIGASGSASTGFLEAGRLGFRLGPGDERGVSLVFGASI